MAMAEFVFACRVPADDAPTAAAPRDWQPWPGGTGEALVDVGHPVTGCASLSEVGGSGSRYTVVSGADLETAVTLAEGCPVLPSAGGSGLAESDRW